MFLIVRSRFWLFPGILDQPSDGPNKRLIKKSQLEAEADASHDDFDERSHQDVSRIYPLRSFVSRAGANIPGELRHGGGRAAPRP